MSWQHALLLLLLALGAAGTFVGIGVPREPRDHKDAGAALLFTLIMAMLLIWGQS